MENATKALLMAGAILIAILLIGVGIIIFRSTNGIEDNVDKTSSAMAASTFNAQFLNYTGNNVPAVRVKSLLSAVIASNAQNTEGAMSAKDRKITINFKGTDNMLPENVMSQINAPYYNVQVGEYKQGYISKITITVPTVPST